MGSIWVQKPQFAEIVVIFPDSVDYETNREGTSERAGAMAGEPKGMIGKIELALQMGCAAGALCVGQHGACNEHFTKQNLLDFIGRSTLRQDDFDL